MQTTNEGAKNQEGVTLLFVMLITTALLAIAVGIFNSVLTQLRLSREITSSFEALYAADQGMERLFYCDRKTCNPPICPAPGGNCTYTGTPPESPINLPSGACVFQRLERTGTGPANTTVRSTGEYTCAAGLEAVRRAFTATYSK